MSKIIELESLLKKQGMMRVNELESFGYPVHYLSLLEKRGVAVKQTRGLYMHVDADIQSSYSYEVVCAKVPNAVICLLSALSYYEIGTEAPRNVWIAIGQKDRAPKLDYPNIRVSRFSGQARTEGIQVVEGNVPFRIYCPAKTIVDCFKFRNKIGTSVAVEALRDAWSDRKFTTDEITHYARICNMGKVMAPYLEAIL